MRPRWLPLALFFLMLVSIAPVFTAPSGETMTYLPLVRRGDGNAPSTNQLLYRKAEGNGGNLFLGAPPPAHTPFQLTTLTAPEAPSTPAFSPDGAHVVYRRRTMGENSFRYYVVGASGSPDISLFTANASGINVPSWSSDNRTLAYTLLYPGSGMNRLYSITIDERTPLTLATNVTFGPIWDLDGVGLYYASINANGTTDDIRRVNADGSNPQLVAEMEGKVFLYGVAEDGRLVVRLYGNGSDDLYLIRPDGSDLTRLTTSAGTEAWVSIARGGTHILYAIQARIYLMDLSGAEEWSFGCQMAICTLGRYPVSWTADGTEVAFTVERQSATGLSYDLYVAPTDGTQGSPSRLVEGGALQHGYSPDGRYFAYDVTPDSGFHAIEVMDRSTQQLFPLSSPTADLYFEAWRPLP